MATLDPRSPRERRGLMLAVLGAWVAVVMVGAGKRTDDSLLGVDHLDVVWLIVLILGAVLGLVLLVVLNPFSAEWTEPEKRLRGRGVWVALLLALALIVWRPEIIDRFTRDGADELSGQLFELDAISPADEAAVDTVAQAIDLLLLVTLVAAVGGVWYLLRRRAIAAGAASAVDDPADDDALEADLLAALDELTAELSGNDDPRMAVLQSYALLESVLAAHGSIRAGHETPTEHLRRALLALRVDAAPLIRLGGLYEIARFSDQAISPQQQHDAARSLDAARRSLAELR